MTMTENEAIKNVTAYVYMECENMPMQVVKALDIMKNCTKEIQQYREIGLTPKMIKDMIESEKLASHEAIFRGAKLELYQEIGTVEEFKALKEKNEPKKVNEDDCCPICHTYGKDDNGVEGNYCPDCGQALDWQ